MRLQIIGKLMPSAPMSIGAFASHGSLAAIRTKGTQGVPAVAVIMACALPRSIGPCSRSTMIQSRLCAMIRTVWMLGMVAIAPKVARPSRHSLRRRFSGAGGVDIWPNAPEKLRWHAAAEERHQGSAQRVRLVRGEDHFRTGMIGLAA